MDVVGFGEKGQAVPLAFKKMCIYVVRRRSPLGTKPPLSRLYALRRSIENHEWVVFVGSVSDTHFFKINGEQGNRYVACLHAHNMHVWLDEQAAE